MTAHQLLYRTIKLPFIFISYFVLLTCSFLTEANVQGVQSLWQEQEFLPAEKAFPFQVAHQSIVQTKGLKNEQDLNYTQITVQWNIADGYYLYQTTINLIDANKEVLKPTQFNQEAIIKYDPNFDKDMAIFKYLLQAQFLIETKQLPVSLKFQGCAEAGLCYPMQIHPLNLDKIQSDKLANLSKIENDYPSQSTSTDKGFLANERFETLLSQASLLKIILIFLLLGVGLCLTPCVLPMMPIISGIVLGREKTLSPLQAFGISSTYVLTMSLTYTLVGVIAATLGASANIQIWMQHPIVLSVFAALFVVLALAMFDVYELRLPHVLNQKINELSNQQEGGSYLSAGIMGILSAVVVSPCISAPLAGALVFISSTGDVLIGGSALFALGMGMGLPLIALCTLGTSFLPKAGAWLNYSKRFFGLLLIAVAIWMLSRFLMAQLILALWGILFIFSAFSFGGFSLNKQDSHPILKTLQSLLLLWGLIMLIGAALGNHNPLQPLENISKQNESTQSYQNQVAFSFTNITSLPELKNELDKNKGSNKFLLLDFYADWCTSCKEVEEDIFENPQFKTFLSEVKLVRADLSDNSIENFELLEQLKLFGPPSILFFDKNGTELKELRIQGTISPENFQRVVNKLDNKVL